MNVIGCTKRRAVGNGVQGNKTGGLGWLLEGTWKLTRNGKRINTQAQLKQIRDGKRINTEGQLKQIRDGKRINTQGQLKQIRDGKRINTEGKWKLTRNGKRINTQEQWKQTRDWKRINTEGKWKQTRNGKRINTEVETDKKWDENNNAYVRYVQMHGIAESFTNQKNGKKEGFLIAQFIRLGLQLLKVFINIK